MALSTTVDLETAIKSIGNARIFVGNPKVANGMIFAGVKDGAAQLARAQKFSDYMIDELTGDTIHHSYLMSDIPTVTFPIVLGDEAVYERFSTTGVAGGGFSRPQKVVPTTLLLVPEIDLDPETGTLTYAQVGGWVPSAPKHSIWIWAARLSMGNVSYSHENAGKATSEATAVGMLYPSNPEGHKVYTIGDPVTAGVTGLIL
jgi:hypothetical protein